MNELKELHDLYDKHEPSHIVTINLPYVVGGTVSFSALGVCACGHAFFTATIQHGVIDKPWEWMLMNYRCYEDHPWIDVISRALMNDRVLLDAYLLLQLNSDARKDLILERIKEIRKQEHERALDRHNKERFIGASNMAA